MLAVWAVSMDPYKQGSNRGHYPVRMHRGKVIGRVVVVVVVVDTKSLNLEMYAPERVVSTTNMSNVAKNRLQYAQNRVARPARVTNRVF